MHSKRATSQFGRLLKRAKESGSWARASYLRLVITFPLRPLHSDRELEEAICVLDRLLSRKKPLDEQEQAYFDSLSHEIRRYEEGNVAMSAVSGPAVLRHLIEARDATLSEVATGSGIAVSTISSILKGTRQLNLVHIQNLARYFGVAPGTFLS
jgi:HTH-type transcriptional regulator/antitoxin HigA